MGRCESFRVLKLREVAGREPSFLGYLGLWLTGLATQPIQASAERRVDSLEFFRFGQRTGLLHAPTLSTARRSTHAKSLLNWPISNSDFVNADKRLETERKVERRWADAPSFPIALLRRPLAVNLFKAELLGEEHLPGQAQVKAMVERFSQRHMPDVIGAPTLKSWFSIDGPTLKHASAIKMDRLIDAGTHPLLFERVPDAPPVNEFFLELACGGLISELRQRTTAKVPVDAISQRAATYQFSSPWHAHADAVEAAAVGQSNGEVPWEQLKLTAARRIQEYVHARWNPRNGSVFSSIPSPLAEAWARASALEREELKRPYAALGDLFDQHMSYAPRPDWDPGVDLDIGPASIHRLMFAVAADGDFLTGALLDAWALDLVTAGLAMHAVAWTDRYATHGVKVTPELDFWAAIEQGFLDDAPDDGQRWAALAGAVENAGLVPEDETVGRLVIGGDRYRGLLREVGLSGRRISALAGFGRAQNPVKFVPKPNVGRTSASGEKPKIR